MSPLLAQTIRERSRHAIPTRHLRSAATDLPPNLSTPPRIRKTHDGRTISTPSWTHFISTGPCSSDGLTPGRIVCDYLLTYGDSRLAAINFVSASTKTSPEFKSPGGRLLRALTNDDPACNTQNIRVFLEACSAQPYAPSDLETMIAYNSQTPAQVRDHMLNRTTPYEEALRNVKVPVLISHGEQDQIVIPAMASYTASVIPHAKLSLYANCGHMPL
jgi:pimeloyl-ACP methyl ester carboxylesterase